ncbi:MAG: hypothetical protein CME71_11190 [Halobacteriovorax sp.]|nr:hypothetical protein [Halobacteriovorax sp.]
MNNDELCIRLESEIKTLISTPVGRRLFIASSAALLSGCASAPKTRMREGDNSGQQVSLTPSQERKMADEYGPQMEKEYPPLDDAWAQSYISTLGQKIAKANSLQNNPYEYRFTLVDAKMVNAFALPAGAVYVTKPLVLMAQSEAELAGVIGHEIGHIQARHTAERMEQQKRDQSKSILYGLGGVLLGGAAGLGLAKLVCKKEDKECLQRIALYGAAAGAAGGLLIQKFSFMANSREDEMEADRIGFRTSVKAGYDPAHVGLFYEKLLAMEQQYKKKQDKLSSAFADALSTHPPSAERVQQMNQLAQQSSQSGEISTPDFKRIKNRLS